MDSFQRKNRHISGIFTKILLKQMAYPNSNNVDTGNDSVYKDWSNGNSTGLEQLLRYSITKTGLICQIFTSEQYTSLDGSI